MTAHPRRDARRHGASPALIACVVLLASATSAADARQAPSARPRIPCARTFDGKMALRSPRPKVCFIAAGRALATTTLLTKLHWSRWGTASASGTGTALPLHPGMGEKPSRVRVRAFRPLPACGTGPVAFTRLRLTTRFGSYVQILDLPCDHAAHLAAFVEAARNHVAATMAIEGFDAVDATACNIEERRDGKAEEWACGGDFAWTDLDGGVRCTETIFGHFVDAGALERAIVDTPARCE